jgi:hypothetical protein
MRHVLAGLGLVLVAAVLAGAGSASTATDLYKALRTAPYPDTALPAAFSSAKVLTKPPGSSARADGAVGVVEVDTNGPDPSDGVLFVVYASQGNASLADALPPDLKLHPAGKVPGHASSGMFTGSFTTTDAISQTSSRTATYAVVQQGNVVVAGFTSTSYAHTGNAAGAVALARSGLAHLKALG